MEISPVFAAGRQLYIKIDGVKTPLGNPAKWPIFDPSVEQFIRLFLNDYLAKAEAAVDSESERLSNSVGEFKKYIESRKRYWRNVASGINWLLLRTGDRQRCLEVKKRIEAHNRNAKCQS